MERRHAQPFKQVFRELYLLTDMERQAGKLSGRYQGHQLNPSQALALWGRRGWLRLPDEGAMRRTFHHEGLSAWALFSEPFYTPRRDRWADPGRDLLFRSGRVATDQPRRGAGPGLQRGHARPRSGGERGPSGRRRPRGERLHRGDAQRVVARDAGPVEAGKCTPAGATRPHRGAPEPLQRTPRQRRGAQPRAQPGAALCIVPVPSQQRGRLFLPFADDDPKTAEVVAKVLMLAQDERIRDPTILEQLKR